MGANRSSLYVHRMVSRPSVQCQPGDLPVGPPSPLLSANPGGSFTNLIKKLDSSPCPLGSHTNANRPEAALLHFPLLTRGRSAPSPPLSQRPNQTVQQYGDTNALVTALMTATSTTVEQQVRGE
jgi:hypothetical protein